MKCARVRRARTSFHRTLGTLCTLACAAGDADTIITDSAGVRVVAHHAAGEGWHESPRWSVTQDLTIGSDSGAAEYQFGRIGDLAVAPNGDIAVIDQLNGVIRVFDQSGAHRISLGERAADRVS